MSSNSYGMSRSASVQSGLSGYYHVGHIAQPSSKVSLSVSASKLKDVDTFTVSDPFCVLFTRATVSKKWKEHSRTEIIWNQLSPCWATHFKIDYYWGKVGSLILSNLRVPGSRGYSQINLDFPFISKRFNI